MASSEQHSLLAGDLPPVEIVNPAGASPFLLIGDHAGNRIPASLGAFGVAQADLDRHIGWDIGIDAFARRLSDRLDAQYIRQRYSRLVIDCNRDPDAASAIPEVSDGTVVPGNLGLSAAARSARIAEIHAPYQQAIGAALAAHGAGTDAVLVSLHSFTPCLAGNQRPWHIGILHGGGDSGYAQRVIGQLAVQLDFCIGDNEPYRMDETDYTVPRHAFAARRSYVEVELRQDLLQDDTSVVRLLDCIAAALVSAR